nr:MAG TPA: hypothetical protein [Caudoviricetes sp.]
MSILGIFCKILVKKVIGSLLIAQTSLDSDRILRHYIFVG